MTVRIVRLFRDLSAMKKTDASCDWACLLVLRFNFSTTYDDV